MGLGVYHETMESVLGNRTVAQVEPGDIDPLPYQDLPLPRGSTPRLMGAWRRWFEPYFQTGRLETMLPAVQQGQWEERYGLDGDLPDTLVVYQGVRRRPNLTLDGLEQGQAHRRLAGCDRRLLAPYKDTFRYVLKVLGILEEVRDGAYRGLPAPEMARLREPFETGLKHEQLGHVLQLMNLAPRLARLDAHLNPEGLMGPDTPVLANLEKLSLLGIEEGVLVQLYLTVLGHSTLSRVVFGKLSKTTLAPLTDVARYSGLQETVAVIRLIRLLSVAESAAASARGLTTEQTSEFFRLCDDAVRIASQPDLDWSRLLDWEINRLGGVQSKATRKLLKLLNLFEFMDNWRELSEAGPHRREAMADFDTLRIRDSRQALELVEQMGRFVGHYYAGDSSARPYFFRALLNCELHGTGRLLPRLGPAAAFTLLWICLHAMQHRVLNFNPLFEVEKEGDLPRRLAILRRALNELTPQHLSPGWLYRLRDALSKRGEAYVFDTGLHLVWDPHSGALTVRFLDPDEDLLRLTVEVDRLQETGLYRMPGIMLSDLDSRAARLAHFLEALGRGRGLRPASAERRKRLAARLEQLAERREKKVLDDLRRPAGFWPILQRLAKSCPHLLQRWLPEPLGSARSNRRLAAAAKLGALLAGRLDQFQDMQLSHELARNEFGPSAAGIVGVAPLQFQMLLGTMEQIRNQQPALVRLLMLALLVQTDGATGPVPSSPLLNRVDLSDQESDDLRFMVEHFDRFRQVIMGEACLHALEPLVERADPLLNETIFLMGVITTAAGREGLITEDLLERFFELMDTLRGLLRKGSSAGQAFQDLIRRHARESLAFDHYREIQAGEAPAASLRHLLDTVELPPDPSRWMHQGRRQTGLERLLRLRGLLSVNALDLLMLRNEVPANFIYRLKGLRSQGATGFHRDLYEGLRLYRGLKKLPAKMQEFLLLSLSEPEQPVRLVGFAEASAMLTYANQTRLLWLGLLGAGAVEEIGGQPVTISFNPLAEVIENRFEMVNEAVSRLSPKHLAEDSEGIRRFLGSSEGLSLRYDPGLRTLLVGFAEPSRLGQKIAALRRAEDPSELKQLYHRELRELKLTSHETLDYQHRLERAFNESLSRLGQAIMEKVRAQMARTEDLEDLEGLYRQAWEEGLELPLGEERLQSLGDLYELNLERLRNVVLEEMTERLGDAADRDALEALWDQTKNRLRRQRRFFGRSFELTLAERFDRRWAEFSAPGRDTPPTSESDSKADEAVD